MMYSVLHDFLFPCLYVYFWHIHIRIYFTDRLSALVNICLLICVSKNVSACVSRVLITLILRIRYTPVNVADRFKQVLQILHIIEEKDN